MRIVIYDNGLSENRVIIKKIGLFITLFAILRVLIIKGDGTVKGQKENKVKKKIVGDTRTRTRDLEVGSHVRIPIYQNISHSDYT